MNCRPRLGPRAVAVAAAAVHVLTAAGAVLGLFALLAASERRWEVAFAWLGAALIVDGVDGPLARRLKVKEVLPRFSGEVLDHTVDYLNYVVVPAFMLARSLIAPAPLRLPLAGAVMLFSLYHFADTKSKTGDGYFVGFPAIWNVAVLYCFVLGLPENLVAALIVLCCVLTLVPLHWVHPFRVRRLRALTYAVLIVWALASAASVIRGFPGSEIEMAAFAFAAVYMIAVGLSAGVPGRRGPGR